MELFVSFQLLFKSKLSCVSLKMHPHEQIWKNERSVQWLEKTRVGPSSHLKNVCTKVFKFKYLHISRYLTSNYHWWKFSIWLSYPLMGISFHDTRVFKIVELLWQIWDKMCKTCALWKGRKEGKQNPLCYFRKHRMILCEKCSKPYSSQWSTRRSFYLVLGVYFRVSWTALNYLAVLITFPLIKLGTLDPTLKDIIRHHFWKCKFKLLSAVSEERKRLAVEF